MNAATSFVLTVSLLLALAMAGGGTKEQTHMKSSAVSEANPSRIAINHNETMLRDEAR